MLVFKISDCDEGLGIRTSGVEPEVKYWGHDDPQLEERYQRVLRQRRAAELLRQVPEPAPSATSKEDGPGPGTLP